MKSILISGGSGFFGRAFARRALSLGFERVCIYSRNEYNQHLMRKSFNDDPRMRWFIGDVRDKDRLRRAMESVDIVIHAAALKRIEVGEYNPDELVKTNIGGAENVIGAAIDAHVHSVVALSTDKAAAPCNAYGTSKRMAETLFLNANNMVGSNGPRFAVTRYGNVAGSTGSVIPIWRDSPRNAFITNPECTRFWMTIDEAVELVRFAIGHRTMFVPNLPAYRLGDLAEVMGVSGVAAGMSTGEKLHESMISDDECSEFFFIGNYYERHPAIAEAKLEHALTSDRARRMSVEELKEAIHALV